MSSSTSRSPDAIRQLSRLERPGFALEFLRRNNSYREDYARMLRQIARGNAAADIARADLARRWGLQFRSRS